MESEWEDSANEEIGKKLLRKAREQPALPIGFAAIAVICGYGAYSYKRTNLKPSLFLIHYRLAAQGAFIGCLAITLAYSMFKKHILGHNSNKKLEKTKATE